MRQLFAIALLLVAGSVQAAPLTYDFTILGDVTIGDESFGGGSNAWDLTAGDVITATGTFTADLGTIGSETGTVSFAIASGNSFEIDLAGGGTLFSSGDTSGSGASISFSGGDLTNFDFFTGDFSFNSLLTDFDNGFTGTMFGSWQTSVALTPVPVPAAGWLFGAALAALGWIRRQRSV